MTVPVFIKSTDIAPGKIEKVLNIIDIAPTVTNFLDVLPDCDWDGKTIF